jgi:preprotein translocase subunit SecA
MNDQRREVYAQRREFMHAEDVSEVVADMRREVIAGMVAARIPEKAYAEQWQMTELREDVRRVLNMDLPVDDWAREEGIDETQIRERLEQAADQMMAAKAANFGPETMRFVEKSLLLQILDQVWKEHLLQLDHLRQGIGLRGYGQLDPLNEYKREAFDMFNAMLDELKQRVTGYLCGVTLGQEPPPPQPMTGIVESHPVPVGQDAEFEMAGAAPAPAVIATTVRYDAVDPNDPATWHNSPRNAPCPCGSGKKYKHCHGRNV